MPKVSQQHYCSNCKKVTIQDVSQDPEDRTYAEKMNNIPKIVRYRICRDCDHSNYTYEVHQFHFHPKKDSSHELQKLLTETKKQLRQLLDKLEDSKE